jgi:hypothetical protein
MCNPKVAAAVAAALGLAGLSITHTAQAAAPTLATCVTAEGAIGAGGTRAVYISGSSAAQYGLAIALGTDVFGGAGNVTIIKAAGTNKINFEVFCGVSNGSVSEFGTSGTNVLVYYRAEGGSVSGLLPLIADVNSESGIVGRTAGQINQLKLSAINQGAATCAADTTYGIQTCTLQASDITGTSVANGPDDSFGGAVQLKYSDIGVTDVEPGIFGPGGPNYPTPYHANVYGTMSSSQIASIGKTIGFQQTFGLYVNSPGPVTLAQSTAVGLVNGTFSDWSTVPNEANPGHAVTAGSTPVVWIDREVGSGSRAAFGIYFLGYGCGGTAAIPDTNSANDGWATAVVLAAVGTTPGGITYASIDNGASGSSVLAALGESTPPTNLDSAANVYPYWFESWFVQNSKSGTHNQDGNSTGANLWNDIKGSGRFVLAHSAPHTKDVNAIPGAGTSTTKNPANALLTADTTPTPAGTATIYDGAYTRSGNSCQAPAQSTH